VQGSDVGHDEVLRRVDPGPVLIDAWQPPNNGDVRDRDVGRRSRVGWRRGGCV